MMIDILLSTYNGEKYLTVLLDSIISQSYECWRLIVRDDESTDSTLKILRDFQEKYPTKIEILDDTLGNIGPLRSFEQLLVHSKENYIMFCDQDDIWLPFKISDSITELIKTERENLDQPIIAITDLTIVDANLNVIHDSAWRYMKIYPTSFVDPINLGMRNYVIGCTLLLNKAARDVSLPFPSDALMHDWWIGLATLSNQGRICPVKKPTILYRQHSANTVGARAINYPRMLLRFMNLSYYLQGHRMVLKQLKAANINLGWLRSVYFRIYYAIRSHIR
ncbi:glycosyltransferase family 2 protein [Rhodobacteraceae bacterium]|nr:glycosyltransferase family 2 protein [Paracoccaceae bacterium]